MTSLYDREHVHTRMLKHRWIGFPWEWKHQDISAWFSAAGTHWGLHIRSGHFLYNVSYPASAACIGIYIQKGHALKFKERMPFQMIWSVFFPFKFNFVILCIIKCKSPFRTVLHIKSSFSSCLCVVTWNNKYCYSITLSRWKKKDKNQFLLKWIVFFLWVLYILSIYIWLNYVYIDEVKATQRDNTIINTEKMPLCFKMRFSRFVMITLHL